MSQWNRIQLFQNGHTGNSHNSNETGVFHGLRRSQRLQLQLLTFIYKINVNIQHRKDWSANNIANLGGTVSNHNENNMSNKFTKGDLHNYLHALFQLKSVINR